MIHKVAQGVLGRNWFQSVGCISSAWN